MLENESLFKEDDTLKETPSFLEGDPEARGLKKSRARNEEDSDKVPSPMYGGSKDSFNSNLNSRTPLNALDKNHVESDGTSSTLSPLPLRVPGSNTSKSS